MVDKNKKSSHFVNMDSAAIKLLFGHRLSLARNMAGLSLRALSDKIGGAVSHAALAKYEKGEMMPDSTLLLTLAQALEQKPAFFFRCMQAPIGEIKFRARQEQVGEKELSAIRHKAQDYFERYLEIESILAIPGKFKNPLLRLRIETLDAVEEASEKVRVAWKLGAQPLGNLVELLESNGIKVYEVPCHPDFDGFSGWIDGYPLIAVGAHLDEQCLTRKRHTLLHELGHLLFKGRLAEGLSEEKVVGRFAGAFMIPAKELTRLLGGKRSSLALDELVEIKSVWGISLLSLVMRIRELDLIPQALFGRFWELWGNRWKKAKAEPGDNDYRGLEKSTRFDRLVHRSIAEGLITRSKAAELLDVPVDRLRAHADVLQ